MKTTFPNPRTLIALALGASLLGACTTMEDIRTVQRKQCSGYGFKPDTDPFAKCMMDLEAKRMEDHRRFMAQGADKPKAEPKRTDCRSSGSSTTTGSTTGSSTTTGSAFDNKTESTSSSSSTTDSVGFSLCTSD